MTTADWLASDDGRSVTDAAASAGAGPEDVMRLRRAFPELGADLVAAAIHQAWLRKREFKRWGRNSGFVLTSDGLEQATRPAVAEYHANLATQLVGTGANIVDLTCGLGFDAAAFARSGHAVTAVERDGEVAAFAELNLSPLGIRVVPADATEFPIPDGTDLVFVDPARRDPDAPRRVTGESSRSLDPRSWSPSWDWVNDLARTHRVMAKVAPGISDGHLDGWDVDFVSADGDLVEALTLSGGSGRRRAVLLRGGLTTVIDGGPATAARTLGRFLIVPDPALVRARALDYLAERVAGGLVHPQISWLTSDDDAACTTLAADPARLASVFSIAMALPYDTKAIKRAIGGIPHSAVTIMTRGVTVDVERTRKQVSAPLDRSAPELVIAVFRGERSAQALLCRRLP